MMKFAKKLLIGALISMTMMAAAMASGNGDIKLGYIVLDETGNMSVNRATFNDYEGGSLSLENFRYDFNNGMLLRANLRNMTLNNRNLTADVGKAGLFSLKLSHNQFRRIYDFHGGSATRRHNEGASLSFHPVRYIELFGGGANMGRTGSTTDLFSPSPVGDKVDVDYKQYFYNGGARITYRGMTVVGEYRGNQFRDNRNDNRDQDRTEGRFAATVPVPRYEWIVLQGGFRHFETKYKKTDFMISSNRGWGAASMALPSDFIFKYYAMLDRTSSDSDYTAYDNLVHAFYAGYTNHRYGGVTVGYQYDVNDQYWERTNANSLYGSGWLRPVTQAELRAEYGTRAEDVKESVRLVGNEDINRYRFSGKYRFTDVGNIALKYEGKVRKNDGIGSKVTLNRATIDCGVTLKKYATLTAGYSYGKGDYENATQQFKFTDHLLYGDATSQEYHGLTLSAGATYYRSKRDLNVESFNIRCSAAFRFYDDMRFEAIYNAHNFDDFLVRDEYYTANIVEINLIKGLSF
jgi:hypothetical protein